MIKSRERGAVPRQNMPHNMAQYQTVDDRMAKLSQPNELDIISQRTSGL